MKFLPKIILETKLSQPFLKYPLLSQLASGITTPTPTPKPQPETAPAPQPATTPTIGTSPTYGSPLTTSIYTNSCICLLEEQT
jgi:hypothetical protein